MIERIALDALALRSQLPELTLREGSSVVARVASREAGHGVIVLAGVPLVAQLPPEVEAGQTLHLDVAEVTPDQVTLRLDQAGDAAAAAAAASPRPPQLTVEEPPRRGAGRRGRRDRGARVRLGGARPARPAHRPRARDRERERRRAPPGAPWSSPTAAAGRLQDALAERTGRAAQVRVTPRRDPFDAYA